MSLRIPHFALIFMALLVACLPVSMAQAQTNRGDSETARYTVKRGDNLFDLAAKYFRRQQDYRTVQRINRISDPRRIPVGTVLKVPYSLLKFRDESARVAAFRGTARISAKGKGARAPVLNETLNEGVGLATGAASSLSLAVSDGSTLTMPSNSVMRIVRLRRWLLTDSLDFDYALEEGAVRTKFNPARNDDDRYRVRTPSAVSAVRGTEFRTRYDDASNTSYVELVEGSLDISGKNRGNANLTPGFGAIVSGKALSKLELLPAPNFVEGSGNQQDMRLNFSVEPVAEAVGYRLIVSRDSGFIEVVEDVRGEDNRFTLQELADGDYFARMSALSDNGLEGMPSQVAFRRRLNSLSATVEETNSGFVFRWVGSGTGKKVYRLQIFKDDAPGQPPIVDEAGLTETSLTLSDLVPGSYRWRVGSTIFFDGKQEENWTEFQTIRMDDE
ncbi:FecR family protein [Alterisphingorhabdus coralli]|uniref:FecR domain-containing protein n=1 Tax=Alterisphingorhabdus coralli TaxID=3071408 RepID=A0AA97I2V3_9SPHN|nr:FecR domain-containing protein [Parasphingorhabdus sp. SCSIO 66989]WOE76100.1 FecR domain-containing protein [Parasphingorhabdus sp. SCSIO 66989]